MQSNHVAILKHRTARLLQVIHCCFFTFFDLKSLEKHYLCISCSYVSKHLFVMFSYILSDNYHFEILDLIFYLVGIFFQQNKTVFLSKTTGHFVSIYELAVTQGNLLLGLLPPFPNWSLFRLEHENATLSEENGTFTFLSESYSAHREIKNVGNAQVCSRHFSVFWIWNVFVCIGMIQVENCKGSGLADIQRERFK